MTAIAILTRRLLANSLLDLISAMVAPLSGLVGFVLLLRNVIDTGAMSYSQYVLPAVVVQAMLFGALTTTDRAAHEKASGIKHRGDQREDAPDDGVEHPRAQPRIGRNRQRPQPAAGTHSPATAS